MARHKKTIFDSIFSPNAISTFVGGCLPLGISLTGRLSTGAADLCFILPYLAVGIAIISRPWKIKGREFRFFIFLLWMIVAGIGLFYLIQWAIPKTTTTISERFTMSLALNRENNLPVWVSVLDCDKVPMQCEMAQMANQEEWKIGNIRQRAVNFKTGQEKIEFYNQLFQDQLINKSYGVFRYDLEISATTGNPQKLSKKFSDYFNPREFPSRLLGKELMDKLTKNLFLDRRAKMFWNDEESWLPIPPKAVFMVPDSHSFVFKRDGVFLISMNIEVFPPNPGVTPYLGTVIKKRDVDVILAFVTLKADIIETKVGSTDIDLTKKWVNYLFPHLKKVMGDPEL